MDSIIYYQKQSVITDPGTYADCFKDLPNKVEEIKTIIQHLIMHFWDEKLLNYKIPFYRFPELETRYVKNMLERLMVLDHRPLSDYRPPEKRIVGSCRDYATLFCSILRYHGIPARTRVAFSTFYFKEFYHDEIILEYWNEAKNAWCLVDPRVTDIHIQKQKLTIDFDLFDVPRDKLVVPGLAWKRARMNPSLADKFCGGNPDKNKGFWYIRDRLIQDIAALNRVEMQLWDIWGMMLNSKIIENDDEQLEFLDDLAILSENPDQYFNELTDIFDTHPGLKIGNKILSYGPVYHGKEIELQI